MTRFLISIALIPMGLSLGLIIQEILNHKNPEGSWNSNLKSGLQKTALLALNPIAFAGAVWAMPLGDLEIIFLPVLCALAIGLGGALSLLYTSKKMTAEMRGSHFCVSYFTNIGSIGGLVVFALLGEAGFILLPFYKLPETLMYYAIGFPLASRFGSNRTKGSLWRRILLDPFVFVAMTSIGLGLVLNISGFVRPEFYGGLNSILIPTASTFLLISIGLSLHPGKIQKHVRSSLSVLAIKFIFVPCIITGIAIALGLGKIQGGMPLKTVFILSSMPAGFLSLMPASLYKLDLDYANSAWIMTMTGLIPLIPWLYFCLHTILPLFIQA